MTAVPSFINVGGRSVAGVVSALPFRSGLSGGDVWTIASPTISTDPSGQLLSPSAVLPVGLG